MPRNTSLSDGYTEKKCSEVCPSTQKKVSALSQYQNRELFALNDSFEELFSASVVCFPYPGAMPIGDGKGGERRGGAEGGRGVAGEMGIRERKEGKVGGF